MAQNYTYSTFTSANEEYKVDHGFTGLRPVRRQSSAAKQTSIAVPIALTCGMFIGAVGLILGHHLYNASLSGKPVDTTPVLAHTHIYKQNYANSAGTAFAFGVKFFLTAVVGTAFVQRLWKVVRGPAGMSYGSMDAAFQILQNPLKFFNFALIRASPSLIFLAIVSWGIPLSSIFTPGSLTVVLRNSTSTISSCPVSQLDFSSGASADQLGDVTLYKSDEGGGFLSRPSAMMQRLALEALLTGTYSPPSNPCPAAKNSSTMCSYNTSVYAPAFDCAAPFTDNVQQAYFPQLGSFGLWNASYSVAVDTPDVLAIAWTSAQDVQTAMVCNPVNASYAFEVSFNGAQNTVSLTNITYIPDSKMSTHNTSLGALPPSNPANSLESLVLWDAASFLQAVTLFLVGKISWDPIGGGTATMTIADTLVYLSTLAPRNSTQTLDPVDDMSGMLQSLMTNVTIGLLALDIPGKNRSDIAAAHSSSVSCLQTVPVNLYSYEPIMLLGPYLASVVLALLALLVSVQSLWANRTAGDTSFTTLVDASIHLREENTSVKDDLDAKIRYDTLDIGGQERMTFVKVY